MGEREQPNFLTQPSRFRVVRDGIRSYEARRVDRFMQPGWRSWGNSRAKRQQAVLQ
jgi:hypothetical protein